MAVQRLDTMGLAYHREQIGRISEDSERLWGEMTAARMLRHLRITTELSLDPELRMKTLVPWPLGYPMGYLVFDVFTTWPKGKFKAPAALTPEDVGAFEDERRALLDWLATFVKTLEERPDQRAFHPLMGAITVRRWAQCHGAHMNHHYRQFGLV